MVETLLLTTLLLGRHDLETAIVQLILGLLLAGHRRSILLGDFAPASGLGSCGSGAGRLGGVHQTLVGELASADEFFGEMARVDGVGDAVHGFGDNLEL